MRFSTLSAHTTRRCATLYKTNGTSRTLSGMADRSNCSHLPLHEENTPPSRASLSSRVEGVAAPYQWSEHMISFNQADQWVNFDHRGKYPLLADPVIQESRLKKVLVDGGSSINVTFPQTKHQPRPLCGRPRRQRGSTIGSSTSARPRSLAPASPTNRKVRSSNFCKTTETYLHGNMRTYRESREN
jgi:hypothetical protein